MARPMLGDLELQQVQVVGVDQDRVLLEHEVPALEGDFLQRLGRRASSVSLSGVLTGADAGTGLKTLREKFRAAEPVAFVADIATATRVDKVLIEALSVRELAGRPERFEYAIRIREYIEPPPVSEEPPEEPPPEPDTETSTLIVEVVSSDPEIDPSQATVTARRTAAEGEEASAAGGEVRTLTTHEGAVWTEHPPAGQWTVEARVTNHTTSGAAQATVQTGQTTRVTITLTPASAVAAMFVVHFWFDRAFVEPCMRRVLADVVAYARANPDEKLVIVGHTDKTGSDAYNQSLSERRARAVFAFLTFGRDRAGALAEWRELRHRHPAGAVRMLADDWEHGLREAQHMLQDLGFYPGRVDDRDGPLTQEAIRAFRCQAGLPPGTTMDDPTWDKLIERYLAQDSFAIPESQFLPNCPGEILKWIGCGEKDPVRNVQTAARPNRRVELLFVRVNRLPADVPQPDTFDLPNPGAVNAAWCLNPSGTTDRSAFLQPAAQPCAGAPPTRLCRPAPAARFTVTGTIQREVRAANGSVTLTPARNQRFVLIDPEGKIEGAEDARGAPVPGRADANGRFSFTNRLPGVYDVEVADDVVARLATETDAGAKGNAVCRVVGSAADTIDVVIAAAPALREIRLPVAAHVMTALVRATHQVRTCPGIAVGSRLPQASPLDDAAVRATLDAAAEVWAQGRVRPQLVDIVHEVFENDIRECEIVNAELGAMLGHCAYPNVLNVFFVGDLEGAAEAGATASPESATAQGLAEGGCFISDRFDFLGAAPISLNEQQRLQVVAHEIGHYLNLDHPAESAATQRRLMLAGTLSGDNRGLVAAEVQRARASRGAARECRPLRLRVTGATQIGGTLSHEFIALLNPSQDVVVDAEISDDLLDPSVGSLSMAGGDPGANDRQRVVDATALTAPPVTTVTATYTPTTGTPLSERVEIRVASFDLAAEGAQRVPGLPPDTVFATPDPTGVVIVVARIGDVPFCIPTTLVTWTGGNPHPHPLRRAVSRATPGRTTVTATLAGATRRLTVLIAPAVLSLATNAPPFATSLAQAQIEGIVNGNRTPHSLAVANLSGVQRDSLFRARADAPGNNAPTIATTLVSRGADGSEIERRPITLSRSGATGQFLSRPILAVPAVIPRADIQTTDLDVIRTVAGGTLRLELATPSAGVAPVEVRVRGRVAMLFMQALANRASGITSGVGTADLSRKLALANRIWGQAGIEVKARRAAAPVEAPAGLLDVAHTDNTGVTLTNDEQRLCGVPGAVQPGDPVRSNVATDLNVFYVRSLDPPPAPQQDPSGIAYPAHPVLVLEGTTTDGALSHEMGHQLLAWGGRDEHADLSGTPWTASNVMHFQDAGGTDLDPTQVLDVISRAAVPPGTHPFLVFQP